MTTETSETLDKVAEGTAEIAASVVDSAIETAKDAIEEAEQRAENAEAVAETLADAAHHAEIVRQTEAHKQEVQSWLSSLQAQLSEATAQIVQLREELSALKNSPPVPLMISEPEANSSIPKSTSETAEALEEASGTVDPALVADVADALPAAVADANRNRKKLRFL